MFNEYFATNGEKLPSIPEINNREAFYLPNLMNKNICKFIQYGQYSIANVAAKSKRNYYTESVIK